MDVLAFVLVMVPFAANPLIYVVSDPNYRRYEWMYKKSLAWQITNNLNTQGLPGLPDEEDTFLAVVPC